jgi:hypothetical protein
LAAFSVLREVLGQPAPLVVWMLPGLFLFYVTALAEYVIVASNGGVFAGLWTSVTIILRDFVVSTMLVLVGGLLSGVALSYHPTMAVVSGTSHLIGDPLPQLPRAILSVCAASAIGAWFCVAAFLWYEDIRPAPAGSD